MSTVRRIVAIAVVISGATVAVFSQTSSGPAQGQRLTFEVVSVKPNTSNAFEVLDLDAPDRVRILNDPLWVLISMAYEIPGGKLVRGPSPILSEKFDIVAKAERPATFAEKMQMLQTLLEDRFRLRIHKEVKEGPVFALVLARTDGRLGPGIRRTSPACAAAAESRRRGENSDPLPQACVFTSGRLGVNAMPISDLASVLSTRSRQTVLDRTGLTGLFDYSIPPNLTGLVGDSAAPPPDGVGAPSVFTTITEQLGLKLERQQGPIETFVIDSVEMPTPD